VPFVHVILGSVPALCLYVHVDRMLARVLQRVKLTICGTEIAATDIFHFRLDTFLLSFCILHWQPTTCILCEFAWSTT